ncbi:MAG: endonuclease III [Lentisphaerae bacterium]|nr:endonuclease III [Lentisphaerota bacterium]MBT4820784.1 endonuclease III [Lentisphaerota bacterium]MBT5610569.1 endonuclease III [Lentisphaerota bacterium]MBT7060163.1 endonuclease III [Lentisphaerota bacterium]MBT7844128.1 endonuclease III [Lentisphaerota bacterium]
MTDEQVAAFFARLAERITPRCELDFETPLDLLIGCVLSAQATDRSVNDVTGGLWQECRSPADYLALGQKELEGIIRPIGLQVNKARAVVGICRELLERFDGCVPVNREGLESLPGVGRKTANVVLNVAFQQPVIAVDTHVFRVANRTGLVRAPTPEKTERQLMARVPDDHLLHAHHYLILHGRYTCVARKPACAACPVNDVCQFTEKAL